MTSSSFTAPPRRVNSMMRKSIFKAILFDAVLFIGLAIGAGTLTAVVLFTLWGCPDGLLVGG